MKKAIIYLIEFLAIQLIVGFIVSMVWPLITKSEDTTKLDTYTYMDGADMERDSRCWCIDSVGMATGADARTAQFDGKRVRHDSE